jgi:hypothetical protein
MMADPQTVVHRGYLEGVSTKTKSSTAPANPLPGQIVFVARPFTLVERLLYPFVKE